MPILGTIASSKSGDPFNLIASTTLGSTQSYIELTGIPSSYTHLRLITLLKDNSSSGGGTGVTRCLVNLNGDSDNNNYYNGGIQATNVSSGGNAVTSFREASRNSFGEGTRQNETGFAGNIIDIYNYSSTTQKKVAKIWCNGIAVGSSGGQASMFNVFWNNTAAISSIRILDEEATSSWLSGSSMFLYGIKAS